MHPKYILEIGEGSGIIQRIIAPECERYDTADINAKLKPTHICDVRTYKQELMEMYDCIIAADILEHIPFVDLKNALKNLFAYLRPNGTTLITIPYRASYFFMDDAALYSPCASIPNRIFKHWFILSSFH